jgi:hypothetical protein
MIWNRPFPRPGGLLAAALVTAAVLLPAGCSGPETGHVAGRVTIGGSPVTQGCIVFEDTAAGISVNVGLQSDGSYVVKTHDRSGLPPGTYKVAVKPAAFGGDEVPLVTEPSSQAPAPGSQIPRKYHSTATSQLTATVETGDNQPFDFDLTP